MNFLWKNHKGDDAVSLPHTMDQQHDTHHHHHHHHASKKRRTLSSKQKEEQGGAAAAAAEDAADTDGEEDDDVDGASPYHDDLIQALNQLSFDERQKALYDLHGVGYDDENNNNNNNNNIDNGGGGGEVQHHDHHEDDHDHKEKESLAEVRRLLECEKKKPAAAAAAADASDDTTSTTSSSNMVKLAEAQFPERMKDPSFLLMFLRAENFDATKAVARIIRHLTEQKTLFGEQKVGKQITLDDLSSNEDDMRTLENGHLQILSEKDRAGRMVIFDSVQHRSYASCPLASQMRVIFYCIMVGLTNDEIVQRRGVVVLLSYLGNSRRSFGKKRSNENDFKKVIQMFRALPLNVRGIHGCMDPNKLIGLFDQIIRAGRSSHGRWRVHQGSLTECKYALMSFGIPVHCIPLEENDLSLKREGHLQWIQQRRRIETPHSTTTGSTTSTIYDHSHDGEALGTSSGTFLVATPARTDIIFGRGKSVQGHAGNVLLNSLVDSMLGKYNSLERKKDKTMLSRMVVKKVKESGGRFLKPCSSSSHQDVIMWEVADDDAAQAKVSHVFRSLRYRHKTREEHQQHQRMKAAPADDDGGGQQVLSHHCFAGGSSAVDCSAASLASFCSVFLESSSLPRKHNSNNALTN